VVQGFQLQAVFQCPLAGQQLRTLLKVAAYHVYRRAVVLQNEEDEAKKKKNGGKKSGFRKRAVVQAASEGKAYAIINESIFGALRIFPAFLTCNALLGRKGIIFLFDGENSIRGNILKIFSFLGSTAIMLDYKHAIIKAAQLLSPPVNGRNAKAQILKGVKKRLWIGGVEGTPLFLSYVPSNFIKCKKGCSSLICHFIKNRACIPIYGLRSSLGLKISSQDVEGANNRIVSNRQKKKGMPWSQRGSFNLALSPCLKRNGGLHNWIKTGDVKFYFNYKFIK
jgi:hypothetical protein